MGLVGFIGDAIGDAILSVIEPVVVPVMFNQSVGSLATKYQKAITEAREERKARRVKMRRAAAPSGVVLSQRPLRLLSLGENSSRRNLWHGIPLTFSADG